MGCSEESTGVARGPVPACVWACFRLHLDVSSPLEAQLQGGNSQVAPKDLLLSAASPQLGAQGSSTARASACHRQPCRDLEFAKGKEWTLYFVGRRGLNYRPPRDSEPQGLPEDEVAGPIEFCEEEVAAPQVLPVDIP